MPPPPGGISGASPTIDPTTGAIILGGLGAVSGAFPTTANQSTSGLQNIASTGTATSTGTSDIAQFLNFLQNVTGQTQQIQDTTSAQSTTPTLSPETQALLSQLIGRFTALSAPSLTGYGAQQTTNINQNADLQSQAVNNIMAARGLSTSPVAGTAQAGIQQNRINQITGMQEGLPVLQNQLNLANLAGAGNFFSTIPKGQVSTGTQRGVTTGTSSQQQTGGQYGGSQATTTGNQQTTGTQQTSQQGSVTSASGGGVGGALSGLATGVGAVLPYLLNPNYGSFGGGGFGGSGPGGTPYFNSDKILKKAIRDISQTKAIEKVRELRGRTWKWKEGEAEDSGVIAQEIEKVLPELVRTHQVDDKPIKQVNYIGIIPYLIGAVQNLDSRLAESEV